MSGETERKGGTEGCLEMELKCEIYNREGKLVKRTVQRSRSFVANFMRLLRGLFRTSDVRGEPDTAHVGRVTEEIWSYNGGSARPVCGSSETDDGVLNRVTCKLDVGEGVDKAGIRVSTSNTPVTPSDWTMQFEHIMHGTGVGELWHYATVVGSVTILGNTVTMEITREFKNLSGGLITVKSVGIVCLTDWILVNGEKILLARDVLDTPQNVLDGQTLKITYTLKTVV